ncbi:hypothetical protein B0H14DRAFT_3513953 [Mycena olivaceomarginata]|nr:hypothetical protein B0H14DRAFT_3513953 [Mycena olivaceomarginata]
MSNSPRKSFAQWKLERNTRQPPPQDNASTSAQPFPHSVDLLRNRNFLKPLGPFDGKVAAFAQLGAEHYFITTNTDYVPAVPSLETPHSVYLRSDMRYGTDDPTLWPQQFTEHYCHLADFVVGSAVTRGLGRLAPARMSPIIDAVNKVIGRCKALEANLAKLCFRSLGNSWRTVMWLEQLQTLPTTFPKMLFALTSLQREVLELDALYEYMTVYKPAHGELPRLQHIQRFARSSPHSPCEPSARVTGRARTYAMDLPKWDSTLLEAASERDHCSPHIRIVSPAVLGSLLHIVTWIRPVRHDPRVLDAYDVTFCIQRTGYDRSPGAWTTPLVFRCRTLSHTGRTHRAADAEPSDEADDIPTQPFPHFTRRID